MGVTHAQAVASNEQMESCLHELTSSALQGHVSLQKLSCQCDARMFITATGQMEDGT